MKMAAMPIRAGVPFVASLKKTNNARHRASQSLIQWKMLTSRPCTPYCIAWLGVAVGAVAAELALRQIAPGDSQGKPCRYLVRQLS
jgi:hypothetical protein